MATVPEIHESIRKATLDAYLEEYKQLKETWRSIETKAQGSIAVAGIFIAGALAFLTKMDAHLRCHEKILMFVGLSCLIFSVILAILALRTKTTKVPPLGGFAGGYGIELVKVNNEADLQIHLGAFFRDGVSRWRDVITEVSESNEEKANTLLCSQLFLIFAIVAVAVLSLLKLII